AAGKQEDGSHARDAAHGSGSHRLTLPLPRAHAKHWPRSGTSLQRSGLRGMTTTRALDQADGRRETASPRRPWDPRVYQIATLGGLLLYGLGWLGFDVPAAHALAILATVLLAQLAGTRLSGRLSGRLGFDPKSALISGLSLCLLLRTNYLTLAVLTAATAIGSKVLLRVGCKHGFNPTNCA